MPSTFGRVRPSWCDLLSVKHRSLSVATGVRLSVRFAGQQLVFAFDLCSLWFA